MANSISLDRLWILALFSFGLLVVHRLLLLFIGPVAVATYYVTIPVLEILEHIGLSTLTGTRDGWAMPTTFGLVLSFIGWACFYFVVLFGTRAFSRRIGSDATRTI
jgi:hypothetical protein